MNKPSKKEKKKSAWTCSWWLLSLLNYDPEYSGSIIFRNAGCLSPGCLALHRRNQNSSIVSFFLKAWFGPVHWTE
jgi:hypothetical protein